MASLPSHDNHSNAVGNITARLGYSNHHLRLCLMASRKEQMRSHDNNAGAHHTDLRHFVCGPNGRRPACVRSSPVEVLAGRYCLLMSTRPRIVVQPVQRPALTAFNKLLWRSHSPQESLSAVTFARPSFKGLITMSPNSNSVQRFRAEKSKFGARNLNF